MLKPVMHLFLSLLCVFLSMNPSAGYVTINSTSVAEDLSYFSLNPHTWQDLPMPPVITSSTRTSRASSFVLSWETSLSADTIKCYKIRYLKEGARWIYKTSPANSAQMTLVNLEPSSLYQVEMVTVLKNEMFSQPSVSSFRTGSGKTTLETSRNPSQTGPKLRNHFRKQGPKTFRNNTVKIPGAPSLLAVRSSSKTSVSLIWIPRENGGSPIIGYKVQSRAVGNERSRWKTIKNVPADTLAYDVVGLQRGASYRFRVIAHNAIGDSYPSERSKAINTGAVSTGELATPPSVTDVRLSNGSLTIEWQYNDVDSNSYDGFIVKYSVDKRRKRKYVWNKATFSYVITSPIHDKQSSVKLMAYNSDGKSPVSAAVKFKIIRNHAYKRDEIIFMRGWTPSRTSLTDYHIRGTTTVAPYIPVHNSKIKDEISQRDLGLICGAAGVFFVILVLSASRLVYQRRRRKLAKMAMTRAQRRSTSKAPREEESLCKKFCGYFCCQEEYDDVDCRYVPAPPPPCSCYSGTNSPPRINGSCLQSSRTSFSHPAFSEQGSLFPLVRIPDNQMIPVYCTPTRIPLCWVRGENEQFCHIVPDSAKPRPKPAEDCSETRENFQVTRNDAQVTRTSNSTSSILNETNREIPEAADSDHSK